MPTKLASPTHLGAAALALLLAAMPAGSKAESYYGSWLAEYDPTGANADRGQVSNAVACDSRGNVYITGATKTAASVDQFFAAKIDGLDGHLVWTQVIPSTNAGTGLSIALDPAGDVVACGAVNTNGTDDFLYAKFSGVNGAILWQKQLNGTGGGGDRAKKIAVNAVGDVFVAGTSVGNSTGDDFLTFKVAGATGNMLWAAQDRFNNGGNRTDDLTSLTVDPSGNPVVAGRSVIAGGAENIVTRKLNGATGALVFNKLESQGGIGGATGVVTDSAGNIFTTGLLTGGSNIIRGYFTVSYTAAGAVRWSQAVPAVSGDSTNGPCGIAIDAAGDVSVSGTLQLNGSTNQLFTVKYRGSDGAVLGQITDNGIAAGDNVARQVITDGSSNTIIVGESENDKNSADLYVAKYNSNLTARVFAGLYNGTFDSGNDRATGVAVDKGGNIVITGFPTRRTAGGTGVSEAIALKYSRYIAAKGDVLPNGKTFVSGGAPAISEAGVVAAKVAFGSGRSRGTGILVQGPAGGGSAFAALSGGTAPGATAGSSAGKYVSFSDPIVAQNGTYAFAAKLAGAKSKANGVWTNASGTLTMALRQGTSTGLPAGLRLASVMSLSMRSGELLALVKVAGPASSNVVLVGINAANAGTALLRTGQSVTVGSAPATTISALTVLSPAPDSPGDGRWQGTAGAVARATLKDRRSVIFHVTNTGTLTPLAVTGGDAPATLAAGAKYKTFGLPAIGESGVGPFAFQATLAPGAGSVTAGNDSALIYSQTGAAFAPIAREGANVSDGTLASFRYGSFSDPIIAQFGASDALVTFVATLNGAVTRRNNQAILFGSASNPATLRKIARLGDKATLPSGGASPQSWSDFTALALASNPVAAPVFTAKLSGPGVNPRNDTGLWAVDSAGTVRRLLRTGDLLGNQNIKTITLLKAVPTAFAAERSVNGNAQVTVALTFTDKSSALLTIGIP